MKRGMERGESSRGCVEVEGEKRRERHYQTRREEKGTTRQG